MPRTKYKVGNADDESGEKSQSLNIEVSGKYCPNLPCLSYLQRRDTTQIFKYLGVNLTEYVKDIYNKNYKTLMKEIEVDTQTQKYRKTWHVLDLKN